MSEVGPQEFRPWAELQGDGHEFGSEKTKAGKLSSGGVPGDTENISASSSCEKSLSMTHGT